MFAAPFGYLLSQAAGMLGGSSLSLVVCHVCHQGNGRACAFSLVSLKDVLDPSNVQFLLLLEPDS